MFFKYIFRLFFALFFIIVVVLIGELILVSLACTVIGLKESFINSSNLFKFMQFFLYISIINIIFNLKNISNNIEGLLGKFKEKYFIDKNEGDVNKFYLILLILCIYLAICAVGFSFFKALGQEWDEDNVGNIINIFIWATYLLTPIVAIWVYSDWREPHKLNKKIELVSEIENKMTEIEETVSDIEDKLNLFYEQNEPFRDLNKKYHKLHRQLANLDILARYLENNDDFKNIAARIYDLTYPYVQYSCYIQELSAVLSNQDVDHWDDYLNEQSFDVRMEILRRSDDFRKKNFYSARGMVYEIQKDLNKIKQKLLKY